MSFLHGTEEYYQKFIELQEKLRKSEEERLKLEMKFNEMVQVSREEEQIYYRKLRAQYKRFLEEDRRRQERNEKILRILERIESRAAMLAAKTQRFELLRKQYHAYLQRIFINVKQQEEPQISSRMPTIVEQKQSQNELVRSPKMDVVKQYLSSLSSSACREQVLKAARSNELLPFSDASSEDYNLPKFKSNASNLAEQIIHSMHAKPKTEEGRMWQAEQSFCGTKLSPSKPPVRKSDDVELFDYGGGTAGEYTLGGRKDLRHQVLEKYDNEKIVQDNYQNEKFVLPREEGVTSPAEVIHFQVADTFPKSTGHLHEDTAVSCGTIPKKTLLHKPDRSIPKQPRIYKPKVLESTNLDSTNYYKQADFLPAITKSKDCEQEVLVDNEGASHGNSDEVRHFEEDNQIPEPDETPETNIDDCGEQICVEKEEFVDDFREDAQVVAEVEETENDVDQATVQIKEDVEGDVNEVKITPQNENQNEIAEALDQKQVETPVYDEDKQNGFEMREETKTQPVPYDAQNDVNDQPFQFTRNEGDQPFQYASNEGGQSILYDEHDQPIQYNEQSQIVRYDEHGQPIHYDEPVPYDEQGEFMQYDEQGRPIQYDEQGQPILYDEFTKPVQYGEDDLPIQYDEQGRPIRYDEQGQPLSYDVLAKPIQYSEDGQPIQYDEQGRPIQYDEQGQPISYDVLAKPIQYSEDGQPIQYDEQGRPIQYDEQGQPISYDELAKPIQYSKDGLPIQYDEQGRPIQYDEQSRPIQYDEQGQPISYDELAKPIQYSKDGLPIQYDEQGQPIQYDEQSRPIQYDDEHGSLIQYDEHGHPVQYGDEQGPPIQYDEQGQPIQYDEQNQPIRYYDDQGQPVYQYDPNSEYYQQPYEDRDADVQQQNQDKVDPSEVIEKVGMTSIVQPQNGEEKEVESEKVEDEPVMTNQKSNVLDMLDTDTESTRQEAKVSNDSDFDFSNS